jgi:hypothetical protein
LYVYLARPERQIRQFESGGVVGEIDRRTVVGAAWAAPVIIAAAAAPAAAASASTLVAYARGFDDVSHPIVYVMTPENAIPAKITLLLSLVPGQPAPGEFEPEEPPSPGWVAATSGEVTVVQTTDLVPPGSTREYGFNYRSTQFLLVSVTVQYPGYSDIPLRVLARATFD